LIETKKKVIVSEFLNQCLPFLCQRKS
jgi:hypothetical protein